MTCLLMIWRLSEPVNQQPRRWTELVWLNGQRAFENLKNGPVLVLVCLFAHTINGLIGLMVVFFCGVIIIAICPPSLYFYLAKTLLPKWIGPVITLLIYLTPDDTGILANQEREAIRSSSDECYVIEAGATGGIFQHRGARNYFEQSGEYLPLFNNTYMWNAGVVVLSQKSTAL